MMLLHHSEGIAHGCVRADGDRIVDHPVFGPLDPADLLALDLYRHILVDYSDTSGPGHRYREVGFCHGVHCSRHDRSMKPDIGGKV